MERGMKKKQKINWNSRNYSTGGLKLPFTYVNADQGMCRRLRSSWRIGSCQRSAGTEQTGWNLAYLKNAWTKSTHGSFIPNRRTDRGVQRDFKRTSFPAEERAAISGIHIQNDLELSYRYVPGLFRMFEGGSSCWYAAAKFFPNLTYRG